MKKLFAQAKIRPALNTIPRGTAFAMTKTAVIETVNNY
jgi:hypothetical protein